jgi:hypothetical protein
VWLIWRSASLLIFLISPVLLRVVYTILFLVCLILHYVILFPILFLVLLGWEACRTVKNFFCTPWTLQASRVGWQSFSEKAQEHTPLLSKAYLDSQECTLSQLCINCIKMTKKSGLLSASWYGFTRTVEWHLWPIHLRRVELLSSPQGSCHFCNILWHSISKRKRRAVVSRMQSDNDRCSLWIRIWKDPNCRWYSLSRYFVQIHGHDKEPSKRRILGNEICIQEGKPIFSFTKVFRL